MSQGEEEGRAGMARGGRCGDRGHSRLTGSPASMERGGRKERRKAWEKAIGTTSTRHVNRRGTYQFFGGRSSRSRSPSSPRFLSPLLRHAQCAMARPRQGPPPSSCPLSTLGGSWLREASSKGGGGWVWAMAMASPASPSLALLSSRSPHAAPLCLSTTRGGEGLQRWAGHWPWPMTDGGP